MAEIRRLLIWRHLRSDSTSHILYHKAGTVIRSGRGLAFWFLPWSASIAEVPCDDTDLPFLFHGRSADFQDVAVQGVITYRVAAPLRLAERVDFTVDLKSGVFVKTPLDQLAQVFTQLAQQFAAEYIAGLSVRELLAAGPIPVRERVRAGLVSDPSLEALGLEVAAVRVSSVTPTAELEKALQTPTRELIQQSADEATFQRRAEAVDKERAIQENELQNQIELTKRQEALIRQKGQNKRLQAMEVAEAESIAAKAEADRQRLEAGAQAESIRVVEQARVEAEKGKMEVYRDLPSAVMMGLAAQEFAGKLQNIEHINITPEMLGPWFRKLVEAGTRYMEAGAARNSD